MTITAMEHACTRLLVDTHSFILAVTPAQCPCLYRSLEPAREGTRVSVDMSEKPKAYARGKSPPEPVHTLDRGRAWALGERAGSQS